MTIISFQIPEDQARILRVEAAKRGISRSEALRNAVRIWLNICPKCGCVVPDQGDGNTRVCAHCQNTLPIAEHLLT